MLNLNIAAWVSTEASKNLAVICSTEHVTFGIKQVKQLITHSFQVNITKVKEYPSAFSLLKY